MANDAIIAVKTQNRYLYARLPHVGDPTCIGRHLIDAVNSRPLALAFLCEEDPQETSEIADVLKADWNAAAGYTYLFENNRWWRIEYDGDYIGTDGTLRETSRQLLADLVASREASQPRRLPLFQRQIVLD